MSEDGLREAFRQVAEGVKIAPDPYTRLMRRHRGRRRLGTTGWGTALAAGLAALLLGPVSLSGIAEIDAFPEPTRSNAASGNGYWLTAWTKQLIAGPPRGALASDKAFINELTIRLTRMEAGEMRGHMVKILFAEDIGDHRIVIAARFNETHQIGLYLAGHRGESPAELAEWSQERVSHISRWISASSGLTPYAAFGFGTYTPDGTTFTGVSLAPAGCELTTARRLGQRKRQWQIAPGGDYMVWPTRAVTDFDARVTCGGVTRFDGPLIDPNDLAVESRPFDDDEIAHALEKIRGTVPEEVARQLMQVDIYSAGPTRVLYGGPVPGSDLTGYLAISPVVSGRWRIRLLVGKHEMVRIERQEISMITPADLSASDAVFVAGGLAMMPKSLVFAPSEAVTLTVLDEAGAVFDEIELLDGIGGMEVPQGSFRLEARNAEGQVVGTGQLPLASADSAYRMEPTIENWN